MTPAPRNAAEQQRLEAAIAELFETRIVFNRVLGLKVEAAQPGDVRMRLPMRAELVGHAQSGRLHGGVVSAVLDTVGGLALVVGLGEKFPHDAAMQVLQRAARLGTIDLRVDYLRQGLGQHFVASAVVTRLGARIGAVQMRLVNDEGSLVATGAAAYVVA